MKSLSPLRNGRTVFLLAIFLFSVVSGVSLAQRQQSSWILESPSLTYQRLYDVKFVSADTVWAVGDQGTILFSKDTGATWETRCSPVSSALKKIFFYNSQFGWIIGDAGVVLATKNYGKTWCQQQNVGSNLNGIDFTDKNNGWICGANGLLLNTTTGGDAWQSVFWPYSSLFTSKDIKNVNFSDNLHGWFSGPTPAGNSIFVTTDGGNQWDTIHTNTSSIPGATDMKFIDNLNGFAADAQSIYSTIDGGHTWKGKVINGAYYPALQHINIIDQQQVIVTADRGFAKTIDGGENWEVTFIPDLNQRLRSIYPTSDVFGLSEVFVGSGGAIFTTTDALNTLIQRNGGIVPSKGYSFSSIFFNNNNNGWLCSYYKGGMFHTTDSGKSWKEQHMPIQCQLRNVHFISDSIGWACGTKNLVVNGANVIKPCLLKTTTGGRVWDTVDLTYNGIPLNNVEAFADQIQFANPRWGMVLISVAAGTGTAFRTTDGGVNWFPTQTTPASNGVFSSLDIVDDSIGWVCASSGSNRRPDSYKFKLFKTVDSGNTWNLVSVGTNIANAAQENWTSVYFINKNIGWVDGSDGVTSTTIYKTIDGGNHWFFQDSSVPNGIIRFANKDSGWVSGSSGVFFSSDGGKTWVKELMNGNPGLGSLFPLNAKNVFVVGAGVGYDGGLLLHSTNSGLPFFVTDPGEIETQNHEVSFSPCCVVNRNYEKNIVLMNIISCGQSHILSAKCIGDPEFQVVNFSPATLDGGVSDSSITIQFTPHAQGKYNSVLVVTTDNEFPDIQIPLVGGAGVANVGTLPDIVDFGARTINFTYDSVLTIKNAGCADLVIDTIMLTQHKYYTISRTQFTIPSHGVDTVTVHFTPTRSDSCPFLDTVVINSNGLSPIRTVPLSGKINQGMLVGVPKNIKIHYSGFDTTLTIKLYNAECAAITLYDSLAFWLTSSIFDISPIPDSIFTIQPGESKAIRLRYMPEKHNTTYHDTLYLFTDGVDPIYIIPLEGSDTSTVDVINTINNLSSMFTLEQNHPNPFSQSSVISYQLPAGSNGMFEVRDMLGRTVYHTTVTSSSTQLTFDASGLPNGLYMYSLTDGRNIRSRIMMVAK